MGLIELLLIAVGLSMDAFAAAVCAGLTMPRAAMKKSLTVGMYFGVFQALMPLLGYLLATWLASRIVEYDHWIAFILLGTIGGKMVFESFKKEGCDDRECPSGICDDRSCPGGKRPNAEEASLSPAKMLPLAFATSVDALAVGVSLTFLKVNIISAALLIGVITFVLSVTGVKIGSLFGKKFKSWAELAGGIILVLMGVKILLEHLGIIRL